MASARIDIGELIDQHYHSLYRYAYRLCGRADEACDLTQETFSRALTSLSQLRDPERARAWLFRILRNEYLHQLRDHHRPNLVPMDQIEEPSESIVDGEWQIDPAALQEALDELDESFRTPLILYYFEEFSYREIAEQMEVPIGTVMSRLARGKSYLRQRLAPKMAHEHAEAPPSNSPGDDLRGQGEGRIRTATTKSNAKQGQTPQEKINESGLDSPQPLEAGTAKDFSTTNAIHRQVQPDSGSHDWPR